MKYKKYKCINKSGSSSVKSIKQEGDRGGMIKSRTDPYPSLIISDKETVGAETSSEEKRLFTFTKQHVKTGNCKNNKTK